MEVSVTLREEMSRHDINHPFFEDVAATGEDDSRPSIHVLNDECMDIVLSFFNIFEHSRLGLVCKRWYNLCRSYRMYHLSIVQLRQQLLDINAQMSDAPKMISDAYFMSLVRFYCGSLRSLSLVDVLDLDATSLFILADMPSLRVLELDENVRMSESLCDTMADKVIPNLKAISFYRESVPDDESFKKMLSSAKNLKFLGLKESSNATVHREEPGLELLAPSNPLVSCSFHGYVNLRPKSLEHILMNNSDTLEYLNLSSTNLEGLTNMVTRNLPTLKRMKVFLASIRHHEQEVDWEVPPTLCSQQLVDILKLMPNLRVLDLRENHHLRGFGIDTVAVIAEHCPLLEELHLVDCSVSTEQLVNLKKLKYLKRLFLGNIHTKGSCYGAELIDTDWVRNFQLITHQVIPHLNDLECLSLNLENHRLPAEDIVSFIDNACPKFRVLSLTTLFQIIAQVADMEDQLGLQNRHDFIEKFAKKCKESCRDRDGLVKLIIHGLGLVHRNSCPNSSGEIEVDCSCREPNFDEIAPRFLKISSLVIDDQFDHTHYYPDNVSQNGRIKVDNGHVKLPRFTIKQF